MQTSIATEQAGLLLPCQTYRHHTLSSAVAPSNPMKSNVLNMERKLCVCQARSCIEDKFNLNLPAWEIQTRKEGQPFLFSVTESLLAILDHAMLAVDS